MKNSDDSSRSCVAYNGAGVFFGVTSVHDYWTARFRGERNLGSESRTLCLARGVVVVIIEAALTYGDRSVKKQRAELRNVTPCIEVRRVVRMDTRGRENKSGVLRGALSRDRRGSDGFTDADDPDRARTAGAGYYCVAVAGERRVREVGVAVEED